MPEVLTAPCVITGDETVTDGAVVVGDRTVDWAGPATALPAEYAVLPRTDYPDSTILPGLIDSHVHLGLDGGPEPVARMRAETDEQQLILMLHSARDLLGVGVTTAGRHAQGRPGTAHPGQPPGGRRRSHDDRAPLVRDRDQRAAIPRTACRRHRGAGNLRLPDRQRGRAVRRRADRHRGGTAP